MTKWQRRALAAVSRGFKVLKTGRQKGEREPREVEAGGNGGRDQ